MDQGKFVSLLQMYCLPSKELLCPKKSVIFFSSCNRPQEEEEWAEFLSDEFYKGHSPIEGEQVQVTKRSYMSEKLVCAPMRISKKFKGELFCSFCILSPSHAR